MMCKFNLKDTNTFASASLDRSIKVWGLGASQPHARPACLFSLEARDARRTMRNKNAFLFSLSLSGLVSFRRVLGVRV